MLVHNQDVHPPEEELAHFSLARPLAANAAIAESFDRHEAEAAKHKSFYRNWGRFSVWMITASSLYSVAWITYGFEGKGIELLSAICLAAVVAALAIQTILWRRDAKNQWLMARLAAEQVRSIKFQAFALAAEARDSDHLANLVETYTRARLTELASALNTKRSALKEFSPDEVLRLPPSPATPANEALYREAQDFYRRKRLHYQIDFAQDEVETLEERHRPSQAVSDYFYITGALLVLAAIALKLFWPGASEGVERSFVERSVEFASVSVFIIGASLAILEHASIGEASVQRYQRYANDLKRVRTEGESTNAPLYEEIARTEQLALRELQDFCEQALLINYRL